MHLRPAVALVILWSLGSSGCAPSAGHVEDKTPMEKTVDPAPEKPESPETDWASASDCRDKLALLQQGLIAGYIETLETTPFALISDQPLSEWHASTAGRQTPVMASGDRAMPADHAESGSHAKRCVIRLGQVRKQKAEHRMLSQERVRSSYQSGSRMEKNPAYEAAQVRLRQAERANKPSKSSLITVGDPLIDLIGMVLGGAITGLTQWNEGDPVEEAIETLVATPRSIEQPIYSPYQFERTRFRASRVAIMPLIMTDRQLQQSWRVSLKRREVRELAVLDGLDRQDRDYAEHRDDGFTDQEFRQWQVEPPELPLEDMVASLLGGATETTSFDRIASIESGGYEEALFDERDVSDAAVLPATIMEPSIDRMSPQAPTGVTAGLAMSRNGSVVEVVGKEDRGEGVYVAPAFVLAGSELVEGRGLVDIDDGGGGGGYGDRVLGLVAAIDRSRGLALIQVPRSGAPVMLDAAWSGSSGEPARSLHNRRYDSASTQGSGPILDGQYLLGFRSERGPDISIREIKAFLDEQNALLISQR